MHLLELFSGTGSMGHAFREYGWEVTSVDLNPRAKATYTCNILEWIPPEGVKYDFIHSSPPCTEFSRALTTRPRDLVEGLRYAERALELIRQLEPRFWTIENPGTGLLPQQSAFRDLPHKLVTYCSYGASYRKLTWFGTNLGDWWTPKPPCHRVSNRCEALEGNRHTEVAQRGSTRLRNGEIHGGSCSQNALYSIPHPLCLEIAAAATRALQATTLRECP